MLRKIIGVLVLVGGVAGLGYLAQTDVAASVEEKITEAVNEIIEPVADDIQVDVAGRDVALQGVLTNPEIKSAILENIGAIEGVRNIDDNLEVVATASPFVFTAGSANGVEIFSGYTPFLGAFDDLLGDNAGQLSLAAGQPDTNWVEAVTISVEAMRKLKEGKLTVEDNTIMLSGLATSLADEEAIKTAMNTLPKGYNASIALEIERTVPYIFSASQSDGALTLSGYYSDDAVQQQFANALGAEAITNLERKFGMPDEKWPDVALLGVKAIELMDKGSFELSGRVLTLNGETKSPIIRNDINTLLGSVPSPYAASLSLDVIETSPFTFMATKKDGELSYEGFIAGRDARIAIGEVIGVEAASKLVVAAGMPDDDWPEVAGSAAKALKRLTFGKIALVDRALSLQGEAANPQIFDDIQTEFGSLPPKYQVSFDVDVTPVSPYIFAGQQDGAARSYSGFVPNEKMRAQIAAVIGADQAQSLELAAGVPDENWAEVVSKAVSAWQKVDGGALKLRDTELSITGKVLDPAARAELQAALTELPVGYSADLQLETLDDGAPVQVEFQYDLENGGRVSGKAPKDLTQDDLARVLGLQNLAGELTPSVREGRDELVSSFEALGSVLPDIEIVKMVAGSVAGSIEGAAIPGADPQAISDALQTAMGAGTQVAFAYSASEPDDGTVRINPNTGEREIYANHLWVFAPLEPEPEPEPKPEPVEEVFEAEPEPVTEPEPVFVATAEFCQAETNNILSGRKLNFVSGSDQLDEPSLMIIAEMAELFDTCTAQKTLSIEIGGHTDSQGAASYNADLSLKRATSVGMALYRGGVPAEVIIAKGFGEALPIASNSSAAGRAENRRITLQWLEN